MKMYTGIAAEKNVTVDFGGRSLKASITAEKSKNLDEMLDHLNITQEPVKTHKRHWKKRQQKPTSENDDASDMQERDNFIKTWAPKLYPYVKEYEVAHGMREPTEDEDVEEEPRKHGHCGFCPVYVVIIISMALQVVVLKRHERALKNLKIIKRAKEIAQNSRPQPVEESGPGYAVVPAETVVEDSTFDYSIEEPASPKEEDKSGSNLVFSFTDNDIKISGIN